MKRILLVALAIFFFYPVYPGFAGEDYSKGPDCATVIEGSGDTFTITTRCGKRLQYLMKKGEYKMWRFEGETEWRVIPSRPKITIKPEDAA